MIMKSPCTKKVYVRTLAHSLFQVFGSFGSSTKSILDSKMSSDLSDSLTVLPTLQLSTIDIDEI